MASVLIRLSTAIKVTLPVRSTSKLTLPGICKIKNVHISVPVASISGLKKLGPDYKRKEPWPYETKKFTFLHGILESTEDRFDENTKVVLIEGNVAAGKTAFAKELAEQLGMHYLPDPDFDTIYINDYGYDYRLCDPYIPESMESCDMKKFLTIPNHHNSFMMQCNKLFMRMENYVDALAHLFNTGQGVVMSRSPYSDFVFVNAMSKAGYLSQKAYKYYYEVKTNGIPFILKPHLVIYLDVPVDICLDRIKQRNIDYEVNSQVLTKDYLQEIENNYKRQFLPELSSHAEMLIYDWSNYGDIELIVDDIERIEMEHPDRRDSKMKEWRHHKTGDWNYFRRYYSNRKEQVLQHLCNIPTLDIPELVIDYNDYIIYRDFATKHIPGHEFEKGFNKKLGESYMFKYKVNYRKLQKGHAPM